MKNPSSSHACTVEPQVLAVVETIDQLDNLAANSKCSKTKRIKPHQLQLSDRCMCMALPPQDLLMELAMQAKSGAYDCCVLADPGELSCCMALSRSLNC